jgi:iron-sulfur cluster repair protein YtfE (RIC family)
VDLAYSYLDLDKATAIQFEPYSISLLSDYLLRTHADYLGRILPQIEAGLEALTNRYSDVVLTDAAFPLFRKFANDLRAHIALEEELFFPYAIQVEELANGKEPASEMIAYSTSAFAAHHPNHDDEIVKLDALLQGLEAKYNGDMAFRILRKRIAHLMNDMRLHCLIEDDVLSAKVRVAELKIRS